MEVSIYIPGLGQSVANQSMLQYAQRFMRELDFSDPDAAVTYSLKTERITYGDKQETDAITILRREGGEEEAVYRFYEFSYSKELVQRFNNYNVFFRSLLLLLAVGRKLPGSVGRLFKRRNYDWPGQAFFMFFLFTAMSFFVVMLLPVALTAITGLFKEKDVAALMVKADGKPAGWLSSWLLGWLPTFGWLSKKLVAVSAALAVLIPGFNLLITAMATEFVCVHYYLEMGDQAQRVQGKLNDLVEFVAENNPGSSSLHFHTYSFGSIIAIDYLFPLAGQPNPRARERTRALFMTGSPYEFINAYYRRYFDGRTASLHPGLHWVNVYSINDALSSNFRHTHTVGDAEIVLPGTQLKPHNINYEIARPQRGLVPFFMFASIRAHGCYWDNVSGGSSSLQRLVEYMRRNDLAGIPRPVQ